MNKQHNKITAKPVAGGVEVSGDSHEAIADAFALALKRLLFADEVAAVEKELIFRSLADGYSRLGFFAAKLRAGK